MNPTETNSSTPAASRRDFLRTGSAAAVGAAAASVLSVERSAWAAGSDEIKVGNALERQPALADVLGILRGVELNVHQSDRMYTKAASQM